MIGIIRWAVLLFLFLTIVYAILTFMNRGKHREQLREDYTETDQTTPLDEFTDRGMARYNKSLKAKLVLGVYLFPLVVFCVLVYFAQL